MRPLNAWLLDESASDRQALRRSLTRHPAISICGEGANAGEMAGTALDVIFTEATFPAGSLARICRDFPSEAQMIIVTSQKDFAWQAFELDAVDFLLKPVEPRRLAEAVRRLLRLDWRPGTNSQPSPTGTVIIPFERGRRGVALSDICAIQAFGNYSRVLFADGESEIVLRSLSRWLRALPPGKFLQVHRGAIVNRDRVRGLEGNSNSETALLRVDGLAEELPVSRRQVPILKKLLYVYAR